jgi:roadblock/LC7 domain-containing protein
MPLKLLSEKLIKLSEALLLISALAASYFTQNAKLVAVVGEDFPQEFIETSAETAE